MFPTIEHLPVELPGYGFFDYIAFLVRHWLSAPMWLCCQAIMPFRMLSSNPLQGNFHSLGNSNSKAWFDLCVSSNHPNMDGVIRMLELIQCTSESQDELEWSYIKKIDISNKRWANRNTVCWLDMRRKTSVKDFLQPCVILLSLFYKTFGSFWCRSISFNAFMVQEHSSTNMFYWDHVILWSSLHRQLTYNILISICFCTFFLFMFVNVRSEPKWLEREHKEAIFIAHDPKNIHFTLPTLFRLFFRNIKISATCAVKSKGTTYILRFLSCALIREIIVKCSVEMLPKQAWYKS